MAVRILSGALLLVVVLAAVLFSEFTFVALMLVICLGSLWEFYRIAGINGATPQINYSMAVATISVTASFLVARGTIGSRWLLLIMPAMVVIFISELYRKRDNPLFNISVSLTGLLYAALPVALLVMLPFAAGSYDPKIFLSYIFIVWINDVFAYFTGVAIGKHRLFERHSPKKSWEGFFGGLIFAAAFAVLCGHFFGQSLLLWGGLGIVIVVSGVLGDLVESMLKRSVGIKDSGNIMPGHGGFMDRFDALLLSAPFAYIYYMFFIV